VGVGAQHGAATLGGCCGGFVGIVRGGGGRGREGACTSVGWPRRLSASGSPGVGDAVVVMLLVPLVFS